MDLKEIIKELDSLQEEREDVIWEKLLHITNEDSEKLTVKEFLEEALKDWKITGE